ncbi:autoinducer binding domain-containing protein [Nguyenibacter vanlangensis]|uniref:LuxR family transcriptional regulator n=1 Tax=Nguyenibacter vanlangensis TaxID=1216886 RepID=A0A7Y7ISW4_9PROT|nr:LuxR family transcriptional regulator [Nguyenibacter vanlangensis]NVN09764.1 LuxR family transcriptional regulator [Nguyenibacter vanlangensis]
MNTTDEPFDIDRFADDINRLSDGSSITDCVMQYLEPLGYSNFAYHIVMRASVEDVRPRETVGLTSYPTEWVKHYIASGFVNDDPVVARVLAQRKGFVWSEGVDPADIGARQKALLEDARDAGIFDGVTVPLLSRGGEKAAFSLLLTNQAASSATNQQRFNLLRLIGEHLHARAARLAQEEHLISGSRRRKSLLTPRETEMLTWVARGKSTWDIAQIVGIGEKSVEFHLDSVRLKLQASNRTQAVVKAIMIGLISHG